MSKPIIRVVTKDEIETRRVRNIIAALLTAAITLKICAFLFGDIDIDVRWLTLWSIQFAILLHTHLKLKRIIRETYITRDE